jgi:hypothetical protein
MSQEWEGERAVNNPPEWPPFLSSRARDRADRRSVFLWGKEEEGRCSLISPHSPPPSIDGLDDVVLVVHVEVVAGTRDDMESGINVVRSHLLDILLDLRERNPVIVSVKHEDRNLASFLLLHRLLLLVWLRRRLSGPNGGHRRGVTRSNHSGRSRKRWGGGGGRGRAGMINDEVFGLESIPRVDSVVDSLLSWWTDTMSHGKEDRVETVLSTGRESRDEIEIVGDEIRLLFTPTLCTKSSNNSLLDIAGREGACDCENKREREGWLTDRIFSPETEECSCRTTRTWSISDEMIPIRVLGLVFRQQGAASSQRQREGWVLWFLRGRRRLRAGGGRKGNENSGVTWFGILDKKSPAEIASQRVAHENKGGHIDPRDEFLKTWKEMRWGGGAGEGGEGTMVESRKKSTQASGFFSSYIGPVEGRELPPIPNQSNEITRANFVERSS